jgi:hypothetical protein
VFWMAVFDAKKNATPLRNILDDSHFGNRVGLRPGEGGFASGIGIYAGAGCVCR